MIQITIASLPHREKVVAELWLDQEQLAEINQEEDILTLEIYPGFDGRPWAVPLDEFVAALNTAKRRLVGDRMIDAAYLETFAATLRSFPETVERLDPGLTDSEITAVEKRFGFIFPPDLRAVLQFALPVGKQFPDWRNGSEEDLTSRMKLPLDGILFDVEHNDDIWPTEWGPRPERMDERFAVVTKLVEFAPKLIPIYSHRYIPAEPHEYGNPVLSVHQTDIIVYGHDLTDYFQHEFGVPVPGAARTTKAIRFWDDSFSWRGIL